MSSERTVLITGATGKQGGSVIRSLVGKGFTLRAMTRKPEGEAGRAVASLGAEVVQGDLDDAASVERALKGVWGAFAVQDTWEHGVEKEEAQGHRFAQIAREAGVQHFVYSSVGSAHHETRIPHFENKSRVEATVRDLKFPSFVILRPVFFMENLTTPWFLNGDTLATALEPTTPLQMIAVDDIGRCGAVAFTDAATLNGRSIDLAGDSATMPQVAATFSQAFGRPIRFVKASIDAIRKGSEDFASMLEWFDRVGYSADLQMLPREFRVQPTTLKAWADASARR